MQNAQVAQFFDEIADLLEIQGANAFRVRAYRNAARTIGELTSPVSDLSQHGTAALTGITGIGDDLARKIITIVETGALPQLNELRAEVPAGVREMLRIPNLGPKKAHRLHTELQLTTLEDLRAACEADRVAQLKGFGAKTQQAILDGLEQLQQVGRRFPIDVARAAAEAIVSDLLTVPGVTRASVAGSCRRRRETCGDLDVLAAASESAAVMDRLAAHELVDEVLQRGGTKQRVRLTNGMELDLRVVPEESYGAALQYFTGSKEHGIVVRRMAQERGLKLNEYGLFQGETPVAGRTEEEVYAAVGLPWIPPELRENRGEIELAVEGRLPDLVCLEDIRGDLHMHTTATDGTASIAEMAEAARARGLSYIAITDHSQRVSMANGLNAVRLRAHWREIERVRAEFPHLEILKGIECDILEDARLDLPDDVLREADWVIAVLHYGLKQPRPQIMKRLLAAVTNPHVDIIGHPSGRLVGKRPGADIDYPELFRAAADHGVMMEINAHPMRLDLDDIQTAAAARDHGLHIVISTDAHSPHGLELMEYGVDVARRAGLEKRHVANTRTWKQFAKLLRRA
jgi:DNA polymerase (family 10)